eukprot:Em0010g141a
MDLAQEKGASNWLTTLTIDENGFTLHKGETFPAMTANTDDGARSDIAADGFWGGRFEQTFFDLLYLKTRNLAIWGAPNDGTLPPDFNLGPVLRSFPKLTGAGPQVCGFNISWMQLRAPALISPFLAGGNLTALVKSKDSCALDICPIAVGKTLRRLTAKCLCAVVKAKAAEFFQPHQFGVSCSMGAEKIAHGPLLFCLVLNILVKDICSDPNCANLSFHSWYLDDGVVAGPSLAVQKFCSNYISNKCGDAKLLLRKLEEVGAQDAQVALVLLRLCGSFCKLAHRARATPPSLSIKALELFDIDVRHCFSQYTAVDTSDEAWLQAQLSLSRGGLGLRSLSSHAAAAYIASLCSSDFGSLSSLHLTSAIGKFNSGLEYRALSAKIDDTQFNQLFNSSSLADRARLLSISSPHASSWLSVVPSEGLGLHLNPDQFQVAIKWWLGLDTSGGSLCSLCPDTVLDPLGHHASTCKRGGDAVFRHNRLRDVVGESCRLAHLSVKVEAGNNLTPDHSHTRPADVLV